MTDLGTRLIWLGFTPRTDFILQDDSDGNGPFIAQWLSASPQPSADAIAAARAPIIDLGALDQATLNAALIEPGSVVRALGLLTFQEINKLRVKNGDAAYTLAQFVTALHAQMR